jgi:hypothetical protein
MIPIRKNKVRIMVVWFLIFLTLNCFVLGQPPKPPPDTPVPPDTNGNQAPKILSIEVSGRQNYMITIEIEDEDPDTITIQIEEYSNIEFTKREVTPISETMKKGVFTSDSIPLSSGPHTLTIIVEDSEGSIAKMDVIIVVSESSIEQPEENIPPQIFLDININIQEKTFTITVEVIDEDPHMVELQIEEYPHQEFEETEVTSISDSIKKGIFVSGPIQRVPGIQTLTIIAKDPQGGETRKQISIKPVDTNQLPQIISLEYENKQNNYMIKTKIHDEDLDNLTVKIKGKPDVTFKKQVTSGNEGTFVSDSIYLDPGSYPFTIVVTDKNQENESTEMQIIINVPKNAMGLLVVLFLVLLPIVAVIVFFFSRRKFEQRYSEKTDYRRPQYKQDRTVFDRQLSDARFSLKQTQNNLENLKENIRSAINEKQINDLARIANENSQTRKDLSDLLQWISLSLKNFSNLNLSDVKEDLETGIRAYERSKAVTSPREEEAYSRARNAYQETMTELKRAHGALDVKILELFMKRARELMEEPAPHGQKLLNYEASKKLSDWVQTLLNDSELRTRLKKLREVGYLDPFGMT